MSSTLIDILTNDDDLIIISKISLEEDKLQDYILDLSLDQETRLEAFEKFYQKNGEDSIEILSRLSGMYQFSGTKILQNFLYSICMHSIVSSFLKLESAKSLLSFEEATEKIYPKDDKELSNIKTESNEKIIQRNNERKILAYIALNFVCSNLYNLSTPCKIEAVCILMQNTEYKEQSNLYFKNIILDQSISCDYRYKSILSLERKNIIDKDYFITNACLQFLEDIQNMTMYRILSGQYLLQKCSLSETTKNMIEKILLAFAEDTALDYNLRADAADTLLSLASDQTKIKAREIIYLLGRSEGDVKTIFDNAQNVHTTEVENSVLEILEFFSTITLLEIDKQEITFTYVSDKIEKIMKDRECKTCNTKKEDNYCSEKCSIIFKKHQNISVSLNRIYMDRVLYSKYNNTLSNILLKVWTFLTGHEHEQEMKERLLEELDEMSGLCSTGFVSRLVNVISGFGKFNIRISWEDQIVANFTGRLNALARKITNKDSLYYSTKLDDVIELYLNYNSEIKNDIIESITLSNKLTDKPNMKEIIHKYLQDDRDNKIQNSVENFSENVINEMTISSSSFKDRQSFLLFFRTSMLPIREEMYNEFKDYISDTDFDLFFRKAIYTYEGN